MKTSIPTSLVIGVLLLPVVSATEMKPSRMIPTDQLSERVDELSSRLAMAERERDPFGLLQDPRREHPAPEPPFGEGRGGGVERLRFGQVVDRLPINAVMPKEGRAMIGERFFDVGQTFPVTFRGRNFDVELAKVAHDEVAFRNIKTDEVAKKLLKVPGGLMRGDLPLMNFAPEVRIDLD